MLIALCALYSFFGCVVAQQQQPTDGSRVLSSSEPVEGREPLARAIVVSCVVIHGESKIEEMRLMLASGYA